MLTLTLEGLEDGFETIEGLTPFYVGMGGWHMLVEKEPPGCNEPLVHYIDHKTGDRGSFGLLSHKVYSGPTTGLAYERHKWRLTSSPSLIEMVLENL